MNTPLLLLAVLLLLTGALLYVEALRRRERSGLPRGEIVSADTGAWRRPDRPLVSARYRLIGRPDYLVRTDEGDWVPVEVKTAALRGAAPYPDHVLQLGAYCLLIEDTQGRRPAYGLLHYADTTVRLPYTEALRGEVLRALDGIRRSRHAADVPRSHNDPIRCRHCGYRHACGPQALA
ncbi:MAG: Dna2/Cas4 domain-containing protein [Anaerolineae bacterium]|nr:Dna2/Cas4 domain-containing protein [Caldilineales bacterium]MCX7853315.1 Dna2/Cas4 domain-containing protein [Caldilineales bacterium]MDW8270123.1 Dna2/Cas4 domain-containing protein [Anaerolineae bacterium]